MDRYLKAFYTRLGADGREAYRGELCERWALFDENAFNARTSLDRLYWTRRRNDMARRLDLLDMYESF